MGCQLLWQVREHGGLSVNVQVREQAGLSVTVAGKRTRWAVSYRGR